MLSAKMDVVVALLHRFVDHVGFPRLDYPLLAQLAVFRTVEVGQTPCESAVV